MQKARRYPTKGLRLFVDIRFQVLFHSLMQGTFHLSLTVLVHYRSSGSIQPQRMVPLDSDRVSPAPPYSGSQLFGFLTCTGLSPSMIELSRSFHFVHQYVCQSYNPTWKKPCGLGYSAFARHYLRNHYCFLFLQVLRCFSSLGLLSFEYHVFNMVGCPIRKSSDHRLCASPRSLSQLVTSFIASKSLGIHRTPLITFLIFLLRV